MLQQSTTGEDCDMDTTKLIRCVFILFLAASFSSASAQLSEEKEESARALLAKNGIEHENRFLITRYLPYKNGGGMISVQQIHQDLVVFDSELTFHFIDGGEVVRRPDGTPNLMGDAVDLDDLVVDRESLISAEEASEIFSARSRSIEIPGMTGESTGHRVSPPKCTLATESVDAELGIYKKTPSWRVKCNNRRRPLIHIDATNGEILMFDSGIRS
jgi:uncharacterized protein YpmB